MRTLYCGSSSHWGVKSHFFPLSYVPSDLRVVMASHLLVPGVSSYPTLVMEPGDRDDCAPPWEHLAMLREVFAWHGWGGAPLTSNRERPGIRLNILQCTEQPPPHPSTKNYPSHKSTVLSLSNLATLPTAL